MFKPTRWRSDKNRIKAAFKLHFHATQVPQQGWETMTVVSVPMDVGRPTARSDKVAVTDGACQWPNPVHETARFTRDARAGKINDKIYQFLVYSTVSGSTKASLLGEASVNLAEYAEAFKPCSLTLPLKGSAGALLHVTIQRLADDDRGRDADENGGGTTMKPQRKTLQSQLSRGDDEEVVDEAAIGMNSVEDDSALNKQLPAKFSSSRSLQLRVERSNSNLQNSLSFDAISASDSDGSSGRFTPNGSGLVHMNSFADSASFLSPLSISGTPQKLLASSGDWSGSSAPNGSTDGSTNNSEEDSIEKLRNEIVTMTRKVELSELELQTVRKQIVKERRRGQELYKEASGLREERNALRRECQELKAAQKRADDDNGESAKPLPDGGDPWLLLEVIKEELNHEKDLNANLGLQLEKMQESNSELLLAVKDLEEMLDQKNRQVSNEQYPLEVLLKEEDSAKATYALEKKIVELKSEVELYKKDHEELEMHMEQMALDYEILKQEHHDISSKLEQTQLREQLRMQYECSAHLAAISDLETHAESLEQQLQEQAEAFDADLAAVMGAKVEQEKRALKAEEELRIVKWNNASAVERIQEEFQTLSSQMSSVFSSNERLLVQARKEASELHSTKTQLEQLLEKNREELELEGAHYRVKIQQLLSLVEFKSNETDRLAVELRDKSAEFWNQKKCDDEKLKVLSEEVSRLNVEMEQNNEKDALLEELKKQLVSLRGEASMSLDELEDLKDMEDQNEPAERGLQPEMESLRVQCSESTNRDANMKQDKSLKDLGNGKVLESKTYEMEQSAKEFRQDRLLLCEGTNQDDEPVTHQTAQTRNSLLSYRPRNKACRHDSNGKSGKLHTRNIKTDHFEDDDKFSLDKDDLKVAEVLKEKALVEERNKWMEAELKEMQERYSEISLKFAEVEGERQQLVMTVRTLKNALKY